jgi:hypothetical protein
MTIEFPIKGRITYENLPEIIQELSKPLPIEAIQHVDRQTSKKGYDATGYGYQYVVNRLNEVVPGHWRAIEEMDEPEMREIKSGAMYRRTCRMTIEIGNWHFIDGQNVFEVLATGTNYGGHDALNDTDARKGAYGNAFKKAAAMLGIGRKAFEGTLDEDYFSAEAQETGAYAEAQRQYQNRQQPKQGAGNKQLPRKKTSAQKQGGELNAYKELAEQNQKPQETRPVNQRGRFFAIATKRGLKEKMQKALVFGFTGKESRKEVTDEEFKVIADFLNNATNEEIKQAIDDAVKAKIDQQQPDTSDPTDDEIMKLLGEGVA